MQKITSIFIISLGFLLSSCSSTLFQSKEERENKEFTKIYYECEEKNEFKPKNEQKNCQAFMALEIAITAIAKAKPMLNSKGTKADIKEYRRLYLQDISDDFYFYFDSFKKTGVTKKEMRKMIDEEIEKEKKHPLIEELIKTLSDEYKKDKNSN